MLSGSERGVDVCECGDREYLAMRGWRRKRILGWWWLLSKSYFGCVCVCVGVYNAGDSVRDD
jgi:hypothetical protein